MHTRRFWAVAAAFLVIGMSGMGALGDVKVGDTPKIAAKTVDGKDVTNQELEGRIIVLDFWATWCGPCMVEAPHMVRLAKDYSAKGVAIIGVSLDNDVATMKQVAKDKGFTWPQICDGKGWGAALAKAWGVTSIPHTFILSPAGELIWDGHPANIDDPLAKAVEKYPTQPVLRQQAITTLTDALKETEASKALVLVGKVPDGVKADAAIAALAQQVADHLNSPKGREALASNADAGKVLARLGAKSATTAPATQPGALAATGGTSALTAALVETKAAEAEKDRAAGRDVAAYDKYKWIAKYGKDTPTGQAAAERVKTYESDADFMATYRRTGENTRTPTADVLITNSGSKWEGVVTEAADGQYVVTTPNGGSMKFLKSSVKEIIRHKATGATTTQASASK